LEKSFCLTTWTRCAQKKEQNLRKKWIPNILPTLQTMMSIYWTVKQLGKFVKSDLIAIKYSLKNYIHPMIFQFFKQKSHFYFICEAYFVLFIFCSIWKKSKDNNEIYCVTNYCAFEFAWWWWLLIIIMISFFVNWRFALLILKLSLWMIDMISIKMNFSFNVLIYYSFLLHLTMMSREIKIFLQKCDFSRFSCCCCCYRNLVETFHVVSECKTAVYFRWCLVQALAQQYSSFDRWY